MEQAATGNTLILLGNYYFARDTMIRSPRRRRYGFIFRKRFNRLPLLEKTADFSMNACDGGVQPRLIDSFRFVESVGVPAIAVGFCHNNNEIIPKQMLAQLFVYALRISTPTVKQKHNRPNRLDLSAKIAKWNLAVRICGNVAGHRSHCF